MLSVIIPTHNRAESVARVLSALDAQECTMPFEVILALDGCSDGTGERVRGMQLRYPLKTVELSGLGAAAARNAGAEISSGDLLLFMDDDIVPQCGVLNAHIRLHETSANRAVVGPCPYAPEMAVNPIDFYIRDWWKRRYEILGDPSHTFTYTDCLTGNLSMCKHVFQAAGGFDEAFQKDGREDYELGIRLLKSGVEFLFAPDAIAYHYPTNRPKPLLNKWYTFGRADVYFSKKHPEVVETLPLHRYFSKSLIKRRCLEAVIPLICAHPKSVINRLGSFFERRLDDLWDTGLLRLWYKSQYLAYLLGIISTGEDLRDVEPVAIKKQGKRAHITSRIEDVTLCLNQREIDGTHGFDKLILAPRFGNRILGLVDADCHSGEGSVPGKEISERVAEDTYWNAWRSISASCSEYFSPHTADDVAWAKFTKRIRIYGKPREIDLAKTALTASPKPESMTCLILHEGDQRSTEHAISVLPDIKKICVSTACRNLKNSLRMAISEYAGEYVVLMKPSDEIDPGWASTAHRHFSDPSVDCVITPVILRSVTWRGDELYQTFANFDRVRSWRFARITDTHSLAHIMNGFATSAHRMVYRKSALIAVLDQLTGTYADFDTLTTSILKETLRGYKEIVFDPWALVWGRSAISPRDVLRTARRHAYLSSKEIASIVLTGGPGRMRAIRALSKVPRLQIRKVIKCIRGSTDWPVSFAVYEMLSGFAGACAGIIPLAHKEIEAPISVIEHGGITWVS